jgi:hypothetical protein
MRYNYAEGYPRGFSINAEINGESSLHDSIYYNVAVNNELNYNVSFAGGNTTGAVGDIHILNNTSYNSTADADYSALSIAARVTSVVVKNNIFVDVAGGTSVYFGLSYAASGLGQTLNYNCWYSDHIMKFVWNNSVYNTYALYKTASSQEANSITGDPLLASPTNYHLTSASPAKDIGLNVGLTQDYEGHPVGTTNINLGAYEYETVPQLLRNVSGKIMRSATLKIERQW